MSALSNTHRSRRIGFVHLVDCKQSSLQHRETRRHQLEKGAKQVWLPILLMIAMVTACDGRTAREVGQDAAKEKLDQIEGAAQVVKEEGEGVAQVVAEGVGSVAKGIGKGLDTSLASKVVRIADKATERVINVTRAQELALDVAGTKGLSVYIISQSGFEGNLLLIAYANDAEVGRSQTKIKFSAGEAKYVDFSFDKRTPIDVVGHFTITASPTTHQ